MPRLRRGGLFGLDGMHLSGVGYGLMAQMVVERIAAAEALGTPPRIDLEALYEADTLLDSLPRDWNYLVWLWRDVRKARAAGRDVATLDEAHCESCASVMDAIAPTAPG